MDFKSCFEYIQSSLPVALMDEKSKQNILHTVPGFESFSIASIECALSSPANEVDIALGFEKDLLSDQICQSIPEEQSTLKTILNKNHFLNQSVRGIWLNYDTSSAIASEPWVYLVLYKMNLGQQFNTAVLSQFLQREFSDQQQTSFPRSILHGLPVHAYILGLALKQYRNQGSTRLVLYGMNASEIITYLSAMEWSGRVHVIRKMMATLKFELEETGLIIPITDGKIGDTIGFELLLADQPFDKVTYILDELLNEQLIQPAKHHAIIHWGERNNTLNHGIRVWINHIKLTLSPGNSWSAKCYFGIQPAYPSFEL